MESAFELFPRGQKAHSERWQRALAVDDQNRCPGKDPIDQKCTCPDVMYSTRIRLLDGTSTGRLYCGCCDLTLAVR